MSVFDVLNSLRNDIVASIGKFGSFTSAVDDKVKVRVAAFNADLEAGDLAESYICIHNNVYVIVQYMPGPHPGVQRIGFENHEYAVRVCMYDNDFLPDVNPRVANKSELAGNLYSRQKDFPNAGSVYIIGDLGGFRQRVGHVIDLNLVDTKEAVWRVEDRAADRAAFIQAIKTTVGDLLPVAERYVGNRCEMFIRHA